MNLIDKVSNYFLRLVGKYETDSDGVIVSCFFNPTNSFYRLRAFHRYYESIKHLPHYIIELTIKGGKPQLPDHVVSKRVHSDSTLWHKESLLNLAIKNLPSKYKYFFWIDADVIFSNKAWFVQACRELRTTCTIIQPFTYCVHLEKNELPESFVITHSMRNSCFEKDKSKRHGRIWRSFASRYNPNLKFDYSCDSNYDFHGHVGFAWGARRTVLEQCPLFDHCLVGGADHVIAHAAVGQFKHHCIEKAFHSQSSEIDEWSHAFFLATRGHLGYIAGDLFHLWHGELCKRQYLKRIQDFEKTNSMISLRDKNGLYRTCHDGYVEEYFKYREFSDVVIDYHSFLVDLSYLGYNVLSVIESLYLAEDNPNHIQMEQDYNTLIINQEELDAINNEQDNFS